MKIIGVKSLVIPEIKIICFSRFCDLRGYFTETYRKSDFLKNLEMGFMQRIEFVQCNESFSKKGTIRGLHFQWDPYMGKLVRTLQGHMVDLVLDIRKGSPTFGKIIAYDMPANSQSDYGEWIWVPPGFAHGNFFIEDSLIEYLCSGEYNPNGEAGISPLAEDLDWSLCDNNLKTLFDSIASTTSLITDKDRKSLSLSSWEKDQRSDNFIYHQLQQKTIL